jgi:hypothetical protein
MNHFEKLLEEMFPTHAYPIKHKLRDYSMMKNFIASRSLTWGMEADEDPDEGDATPFPTTHRGCVMCLTRVQEP